MKASNALIGQEYKVPAKGQRPTYSNAFYEGWNYTREWLLFLVFDETGQRKIITLNPNEEIEEI